MKVFVSIPFDPLFDTIFQAIEHAANETKLKAYRVDQEHFAKSIPDSIEREIRESIIFIADITGNNPNVLNEIGQAQALGKPIILISQDLPTNAPFNIQSLQIKNYSKDALNKLIVILRQAFSEETSPNETLRAMLVPGSLGRQMDSRKFVIATSPLSYRRAIGRSGGYKKLRNTASDYVGLRGILQAFGLLYGFKTLPEVVDPEDCTDRVIEEQMTLYNIASPKANRWTGMLLKKFSERWIPSIDFRADPASDNLKNVKISLYKDNALLYPSGWKLNVEMDRYQRDFGIIIRGQNPYNEKEMLVIMAGRSSLGTEAACRAFTDPKIIDEIRKRLSGLNVSLEDHKQAFWSLVSMNRMIGDEKEEAILSSLQVAQVDIFHPV